MLPQVSTESPNPWPIRQCAGVGSRPRLQVGPHHPPDRLSSNALPDLRVCCCCWDPASPAHGPAPPEPGSLSSAMASSGQSGRPVNGVDKLAALPRFQGRLSQPPLHPVSLHARRPRPDAPGPWPPVQGGSPPRAIFQTSRGVVPCLLYLVAPAAENGQPGQHPGLDPTGSAICSAMRQGGLAGAPPPPRIRHAAPEPNPRDNGPDWRASIDLPPGLSPTTPRASASVASEIT